MKLSQLWTVLFFMGASGTACANLKECKFYNSDTRMIMSPGTQPVITLRPSVSTTTLLATINMELTPTLTSHCDGGNDGENVYQKTDNSLLIGSIDNKALFRTNIPNVEYSIAVLPKNNSVTPWFPLNSGAYYKTAINTDNESWFADVQWYARMELYQRPGILSIPSGVSFISSVGGTIGNILIGDPATSYEDHPRPLITISDMLFNIPIVEPSCALTAPTTVDLGNWFRADVENDKTTEVPFQITGSCVGTTKVSVVVKSSNTTADKGFFTNAIVSNSSITAASGAAVKISSPLSSHVYADGPAEPIAMNDIFGAPVNSVNATYKARLVKAGSAAITSGIFGTTVTFQVSYE